MEKDMLTYKNMGKEVFHDSPTKSIQECKAFSRHPPGTQMALNIFTCLLKSKSVKENETCIEQQSWRRLLWLPHQFYEDYNQFFDDLDNSLPLTEEHIEKMDDLKLRIKKFNEEGSDFWDLEYQANQSTLGHRMTIAIDVIFKMWDLKYSMSILEK